MYPHIHILESLKLPGAPDNTDVTQTIARKELWSPSRGGRSGSARIGRTTGGRPAQPAGQHRRQAAIGKPVAIDSRSHKSCAGGKALKRKPAPIDRWPRLASLAHPSPPGRSATEIPSHGRFLPLRSVDDVSPLHAATICTVQVAASSV
ncbi:hypothetical protein MRX96_011646 [Rhipicephalus microplus]